MAVAAREPPILDVMRPSLHRRVGLSYTRRAGWQERPARRLGGDGADNFSIDGGATLLKLFNNSQANGLDTRDWAPGTDDAFNQFSTSGVLNRLSGVDLQVMDVIGYDLVRDGNTLPEPASLALAGAGLLAATWARRRRPLR